MLKRKAELVAKKVNPGDKNGQAAFDRDLARMDGDLARQSAFIEQKKREIIATNAKYDGDKERWQAALARKQGTEEPPATPASTAKAGSSQGSQAKK